MNAKEKVFLECALKVAYMNISYVELLHSIANVKSQTKKIEASKISNEMRKKYEEQQLLQMKKKNTNTVEAQKKLNEEKIRQLQQIEREKLSQARTYLAQREIEKHKIKQKIQTIYPIPKYDKSKILQYEHLTNEKETLEKHIESLKKQIQTKREINSIFFPK